MGGVLEIQEFHQKEISPVELATVSLVQSQCMASRLHILLFEHLTRTALTLQWNILLFLM